jgi:hypothetical protein
MRSRSGVFGHLAPAVETRLTRDVGRIRLVNVGAPGRIRTCDARFRKPTLYPLSYGGGPGREDGGEQHLSTGDHEGSCKARGSLTACSRAAVGTYADPRPPQLARNFSWTGRYEVPDLGVEVPFTWNGNDGNLQMIAGGESSQIHFTNLVYDGTLYTLTYKWPDVERRPCSPLGPFTLNDLNKALENARLSGPKSSSGENQSRSTTSESESCGSHRLK